MLNRKKRYLQVALNGTLSDAQQIIASLPVSDRIILEAGTPFIKRYGAHGIAAIKQAAQQRAMVASGVQVVAYSGLLVDLWRKSRQRAGPVPPPTLPAPYIVADLKTMDRGATEVALAAEAGASGAIALGLAPTETLDAFIAACHQRGLDAMVDMMNVPFPIALLRALKHQPEVVVLHRGVDEEAFNKEKQIPFHEIHRIKANYNLMIAIAGGDTMREVQRAIFNDADIVVAWKSFYAASEETAKLAREFLNEIR